MNIPLVPKPETPAFVDKVIVQLQNTLKANLIWLNYSFGRAQRLTTTKDSRPYVYPGVHIGNGEYINVFPDDNYKNFSFFIIEDPQVIIPDVAHVQNKVSTRYALIIWLNLNSVFAGLKDRNSETIKEQVLAVLTKKIFLNFGRITIDKIYDQAENIYRGYNIKEVESQFLMQPYFGLRFEGELSFIDSCS